MSLKRLIIVSILGCSSFAFADNTSASTDDGQRMWTILAAENHAAHANDSKTVTDPGVFVTAQRDPHAKK